VRALAVVALAAALVVPLPTAAHATTDNRDKLMVLAGSTGYLAYGDYPISMTSTGQPDLDDGSLHVLAKDDVDVDLGTQFADTDPRSADHYEFSIVGSMLTAYSPGLPAAVHWWNLAAGTSGAASLPTGARWQGSAPNGWVLVEPDNTTLAVESTTRVLTSYGQPLQTEAELPGVIDAVSGADGVVTVGEDDATAAYQPWGNPRDVVALNHGQPAGSTGFRCESISVDVAGCTDTGPNGTGTTNISLPLSGATLRSYPGCGTRSTALESQLVFVCGTVNARPRFASGAATVTRSADIVAASSGVSAFGRFVTTGPARHAIVELRTSQSAPRLLVTIPGPLAQYNDDNLRAAASAVESEALSSGALHSAPTHLLPAQLLQASSDALIRKARAADHSLAPRDTRPIMGPVPHNLSHRPRRHPRHHHITVTHSLARFSHALPDRGATGFGMHRDHDGAHPAPFERTDGIDVDPKLAEPTDPTVGMVALHTALQKLGQPYVWAAAGPSTFDCSGLTQWAYAHAGIWLTHFTGDQWNEGRLIPPSEILPGDLILFEYHHSTTIHHVGMYVGAGWMVNAPYTGQYVDLVPVPPDVAGVVRP
jgi:cell wall-associated NlpC family hydrolase